LSASLARHWREIRAGGWPVFARKARTAGRLVLWLVPALIMRLLRPLVLIRIGALSSNRIGHLTFEPDIYLCRRHHGHEPHAFDVFFHSAPVCNRFLHTLWARRLRIWQWTAGLHAASSRLPGQASHEVPQYVGMHDDPEALLSRTPAQVGLTSAEVARGDAECEGFGVPREAKIVCFHFRDSAYLTTAYPSHDWSYHDFRDVDPENYRLMAEALAARGYYVLRFGSVVREPFRSSHPRIIDYSTSGRRSEFLDLYLIARCHFMVATTAGPCGIAWLFRRPVVYVNVTPLLGLQAARVGDVFVPKRYRSRAARRDMTFAEIYRSGAADFYRSELYERAGIDVLENTAEEIRSTVLELDDRLAGKWQAAPGDDALQERFQAIFRDSTHPRHCLFTRSPRAAGKIVLRAGAQYLRDNRHLL
jgi:putative glycosyltransferase (TIGR04372 family)